MGISPSVGIISVALFYFSLLVSSLDIDITSHHSCTHHAALQPPQQHHQLSPSEDLMGKDYKHGKKGKTQPSNEYHGYDGGHYKNRESNSVAHTSFVRKLVDPETEKYFSEIVKLFESDGIDMDERTVICGNALEETRGKELELATDYITSNNLETILMGSDAEHLCAFLQNCAKDFCYIAMDRSGSHVAEKAFESLASHLDDDDARPVIEEAITKICQVIVANPLDVMCNCYGSHVLRRLLCLCKGVPPHASEFHTTKSSTAISGRFNNKETRFDEHSLPSTQLRGFPDLLKFLVYEMLKIHRKDLVTLQVDQYSSLVLQTALKLLAGDDQVLMHIIPILLGCNKEIILGEDAIKIKVVRENIDLMKDTASSRLMEVILQVAPDTLYNGLITKVFAKNLLELSTDHCGNFVIQALISNARSEAQMEIIWEELGLKFKDLLEVGRSQVIASLIAASQRLNTHEKKCSQALSDAFCLNDESSECIVPRILFLENFLRCGDKSKWNWASGIKIHVMGSLILQAVFRYRSEFIQPFISSLISMEAQHMFETTKDAGGTRVIEAFLDSNTSGKLKRKLVAKLKGYFGELSMNPSSSFTVEKCFGVSSVSLREAIVSELVAVRAQLSKTRQGPHLLRKLDIDGFARNCDVWRSKQASKESTSKKFAAIFGSNENIKSKTEKYVADTRVSDQNKLKIMRKEIEDCLPTSTTNLSEKAAAELGTSAPKRRKERTEDSKKYLKLAEDDDVSKEKTRRSKKKETAEEGEKSLTISKGGGASNGKIKKSKKKKKHDRD